MCSAFTLDCGYDSSFINLNREVYRPNTECSGKVCLHNRTFKDIDRREYQCPQCTSVCQVRNIHFDDQTNSLISSFGQGVYIFEDKPKSIQDLIGDVDCLGKYCSNLFTVM